MKRASILFFLFLFFFTNTPVSFANETASPITQPEYSYDTARIVTVKSEKSQSVNGVAMKFQVLELEILSGSHKDKVFQLEHNIDLNPALKEHVRAGQKVVVRTLSPQNERVQIQIIDIYRLPTLGILAGFFVLVVLLVTGWKGLGALTGLIVSIGVIIGFIVPQILAGSDPLQISLIGAVIILLVTTYLAHGFSKQTSIAVLSTFLSLLLTYVLAIVSVEFLSLSGYGSDESYSLGLNNNLNINLKGLLLGGIIIGTLGALNDMTVTQVAAITALVSEQPKQNLSTLLRKGFDIGRQHILSLVNTLVLAYAGTALPVFMFLVINPLNLPLWTIINNETFSEEIVRSLVGSLGLILAVPITTVLASYLILHGFIGKKSAINNVHKH